MSVQVQRLLQALDYAFERPELLEQALTHRSYVNESAADTDNERLEFLGDAVLDLLVSEALMERFPQAKEGRLSQLRAYVVSEVGLAQAAERIGLGPALRLGRGEELSGGRTKPSLLADAMEAVVAAVYLDGGFEAARRVVGRLVDLPDDSDHATDAKSTLQQRIQAAHRATPEYRLVQEVGPDHDKTFVVEVHLQDDRLGTGVGRTKKEAEQRAAAQVLASMEDA